MTKNRKPFIEHPIKNLTSIADLERDDKLVLLSDDEAMKVKQDYGEPYAEEMKDYDGFFAEFYNGVYVRIYGFSGKIPYLWQSATRLKTVDELVHEIVATRAL